MAESEKALFIVSILKTRLGTARRLSISSVDVQKRFAESRTAVSPGPLAKAFVSRETEAERGRLARNLMAERRLFGREKSEARTD